MDIKLLWNKTIKYITKKVNKYRIKSFYAREIFKGKTLIARLLDRLFISLMVFIGLFIFLFIKVQNIYLSLIISSFIAILLFLGIIFKDFRTIEKSKGMTKNNVVENNIYNELLNRSPEEFVDYFIDLFKELDYIDILKIDSKDLNISLERNNVKIGVKLLQYTKGYDVNEGIIRDFFMELRRNDFDEGIIITTTDYTEEANNLIKKIQKHMKIYLLNMKDVVEILNETSMFPKEKDIEGYILNKMRSERKNINQYSHNIISPNKWKKYLLSGFMLWIFGKFTNFYTYYLIVSIILFSLGLVSLLKKIIVSINEYKKEEEKNCSYDFIYKE
ncbi:restriction endonuclease [Clostridium sp. D2Q-14]|uniref:restriction endonuclease n=1 Tax=Anaeromonas gelatinilytica TaxID=2683194 RepID=UPI00193C309D|nr:restriction endonuclease [Anaeromonas gelatinilytica]MBS4535443.1 restriction endonuclease [Anaeromonas gelatinilytica]